MRIRVVNRARWRQVKITTICFAWLAAVASGGGLESDGVEPIPSVAGVFVFGAICVALIVNVVREERLR